MWEDGEIQQKPTTKHQAGKQDVNQAASLWLEARSGGEKCLGFRWSYAGENQLREQIPSNFLLAQVGRWFCREIFGPENPSCPSVLGNSLYGADACHSGTHC